MKQVAELIDAKLGKRTHISDSEERWRDGVTKLWILWKMKMNVPIPLTILQSKNWVQ